jgi:environmental stress-induced protein Ves
VPELLPCRAHKAAKFTPFQQQQRRLPLLQGAIIILNITDHRQQAARTAAALHNKAALTAFLKQHCRQLPLQLRRCDLTAQQQQSV